MTGAEPTLAETDGRDSARHCALASGSPLVLSLFPGIGLLDRAFESEGFCIVRGPDPLWGGDVHDFHPPAGRFSGIIGGPPCKAFSSLVHINIAQGREPAANLIPEYERVVAEAQPDWFVMENVPAAPEPSVEGYTVRSVTVNNRWFGGVQNRVRRFSFGTRDGRALHPQFAPLEHIDWQPAVTCSVGGRRRSPNPDGIGNQVKTYSGGEIMKGRALEDECELQGLPRDFLKDSPLTAAGKKTVVGNGVPLPMGKAIARAVRAALANIKGSRTGPNQHEPAN